MSGLTSVLSLGEDSVIASCKAEARSEAGFYIRPLPPLTWMKTQLIAVWCVWLPLPIWCVPGSLSTGNIKGDQGSRSLIRGPLMRFPDHEGAVPRLLILSLVTISWWIHRWHLKKYFGWTVLIVKTSAIFRKKINLLIFYKMCFISFCTCIYLYRTRSFHTRLFLSPISLPSSP